MTVHFPIAILILSTLSVSSVVATEPIEIAVTNVQHAGDTIQSKSAAGQARIRVSSAGGIGYCTLTPKKGVWPQSVSVLLEKFDELESFTVTVGRLSASGGRKSSGRFELCALGGDRNNPKRSEIGTLNVAVERRDDGMLVTFPANLLAGEEPLTIHWINWLRH